MANKDVVKCKQCGKTIVGKSRFGLCEQCFSSDAKKGGGIGAAALGLIIKFRKPIDYPEELLKSNINNMNNEE